MKVLCSVFVWELLTMPRRVAVPDHNSPSNIVIRHVRTSIGCSTVQNHSGQFQRRIGSNCKGLPDQSPLYAEGFGRIFPPDVERSSAESL